MKLNEWLSKFAPMNIWFCGYTDAVRERYPYIEIDMLMAWESRSYVGARDVLNYATFLMEDTHYIIESHKNKVGFGRMPENIETVRVDDEYHMRSGYERLTLRGKFVYKGDGFTTTVSELTWHRHDGQGEDSGTIEFCAYI